MPKIIKQNVKSVILMGLVVLVLNWIKPSFHYSSKLKLIVGLIYYFVIRKLIELYDGMMFI